MKSSTYQFRRCSHFLNENLLPTSHIEVQIAVEMWDFWAGDATAPRDLTSLRTTKWRLNPDHDESAHFQGKKHPMIPNSHPHCRLRSQAYWNQKNALKQKLQILYPPMMFPQSSLLGTQDGDKNPNDECWYLCKHQIPKAVADVQDACVCVSVCACCMDLIISRWPKSCK